MLVIISDLHLVDGTTGSTVSPGACQIFAERLELLAHSASYRADGSYRPIQRIDILLLGDVLDVTRSSRWLADGHVRPWDNPSRPDFVETVTNITSDILRHNDQALHVFRGLSQEGAISLAPASDKGEPVHAAGKEPVAVRMHYMVGNHDWFFHLPGGRYDVLRQALIGRMGLAHENAGPFPHDPAEKDLLREVLRRHRVLARHGDIFDPLSYDGDRDASSLGDAMVIELVNRFAAEVSTEMADELPVGMLRGLREIDNVRPLVLIPVWLDGLLDHTGVPSPLRRRIKMNWDRLADELLQLPFVRSCDSLSTADMVDGLDRVLKFSKQNSVSTAASVGRWLRGLRDRDDPSYAQHALAEPDFRNRRAKHIVYGHTHQMEQVPLDASHADAFVLDQVYFNCGTWRRLYQPTRLNPTEREFIATDTMSYLAFFQGDERRGHPYETWSGTLGARRSDAPVHRIDTVQARDAAGKSLSPPRVRTHAPHFTSPTAKPRIVPTRRV